MNEELINDLKQFITATVAQATADQATKSDLADMESRINARFDARFDDLDAKVTTIADAHAEMLEDYEGRIGRLEAGGA